MESSKFRNYWWQGGLFLSRACVIQFGQSKIYIYAITAMSPLYSRQFILPRLIGFTVISFLTPHRRLWFFCFGRCFGSAFCKSLQTYKGGKYHYGPFCSSIVLCLYFLDPSTICINFFHLVKSLVTLFLILYAIIIDVTSIHYIVLLYPIRNEILFLKKGPPPAGPFSLSGHGPQSSTRDDSHSLRIKITSLIPDIGQ